MHTDTADATGKFADATLPFCPILGIPKNTQYARPYKIIGISTHIWLDVFLGVIKKTVFSTDPSERMQQHPTVMLKNASIYRYLLLFPLEYFCLQLLNDLVKHALAIDISLSGLESSAKFDVTMALIAIRIFLKRAYAYIGTIDQDQVCTKVHYIL